MSDSGQGKLLMPVKYCASPHNEYFNRINFITFPRHLPISIPVVAVEENLHQAVNKQLPFCSTVTLMIEAEYSKQHTVGRVLLIN